MIVRKLAPLPGCVSNFVLRAIARIPACSGGSSRSVDAYRNEPPKPADKIDAALGAALSGQAG